MANHPNWRLPEVATFTLESPDFADGGRLPDTARADGGNRSPALSWHGAPEGTKSFALTVYDPDAPTGSGFWHWAVYNIPADVTSLPAGAGTDGTLPQAAVVLPNDMRDREWMGAAPPPGDGEHRYFFTVSALSDTLQLDQDSTPTVLGFMLRGIILGRAQLVGVTDTPA
ncbi:MAG: YbhB/YbcL family Raf kinase inhibitor-like protein [Actinomycetota bacterium]